MAGLATALRAHADPCEAIPENGATPAYLKLDSTFAGPVVHVIDGDSLCVAVGPRQGLDWVEVRLGDFYAPEYSTPAGKAARAALARIAEGKQAVCVAGLRTYDRIAARCRIDGHPIGDLMLAAGVKEGGNGDKAASRYRSAAAPRAGHTPVPAGLSCAQFRAMGGVRRGEPGYRPEWDGDHDGIACEPYRRGYR